MPPILEIAMKGTLKIAQEFEDALYYLWDGGGNRLYHERVYSCDTVSYISHAYEYIKSVAPQIIDDPQAFGVNSDCDRMLGYSGPFYKVNQLSKKKRMQIQMQRALWLTMLAELAEQGEEF